MLHNAFVLDEDHLAFRDTVRALARTELLDGYHVRAASTDFPHRELRTLADAGLIDLTLAEEHGGQGADLLALALACEEVGYADPNLGYVLFATNSLVSLLAEQQSAAIRRWVRPVAVGEALGCWAVTEPGTGSDAAALRTKAVRVDGGWVLTGEKTSVTQAPHADIAVVLAQTDPALGARGIGCFLVECADPSVSSQRFTDPGFKPLGRGSVTMDGTVVPDDRVLAAPGTGFGRIMAEFDLSRTLIALTCIGAAQRALDAASAYVRERTAFGRPLAANQGVSFPIAEHTTYLAAVRALAYQTIGLRMAGLPHTTQAAMLKWWAPRVAFAAIQEAVVLHGQVGWSDEMPLQSLLRDVSGYQIGDGTPQIQKIIIARDVLGRDPRPRP
ncbi:acyl-CoA dehydrogenase family protein [Pseudonocardia kujensis]|uniref:acyl-CoA dehydrogenase family protein n=1 Tax=Pseudonocardia kujensis TaxID=1128675 RepID=UPI001E384977|nr:acyl-CoA dehydrogenase family protein [Pseudonocardia kujensis]MCE0764977.1 acyl-CoA dehydrogenase family protein [Pseudonocardia kujensis]